MGVLAESRLCLAAGLVMFAALPALAADTKPEATPAAEAAAAMARAERQAANPLKAILQASKMKRKAGNEAEAAPASANPSAVTATATAGTAAAATTTAVLSSAAARNSPLLTQAGAASEALPTLQSETRITLNNAALPSAVAPAVQLQVQPQLIEMVEPAIPARVLDEIGSLVGLRADLSLRADGSVAAVTLVQPVPRQLVRYVTEALQRWRYAPLPADQMHRVQLIFNDAR